MPNNPRSFQKFQKMPLFFAIVFLAASMLAFFFLYKQIDNNTKTAEQAQTDWQAESDRRGEVESLDLLLKSTEEERGTLESHFAQSSDVVPFLDTIQQLAVSSKATSAIASVAILQDKTGLMIDVNASGSFASVYKFLTLLENSPYELNFTSVDLKTNESVSADGKTTPTQKWEADFQIKLLSFIQ
jgi:hypothetical protein